MSALSDIRIEVQEPGSDANARAVLREIATLLEQLLATGKGASIDLGGLPLTPQDYELLESSLGKGEVSAVVESLGPTDVLETAIPGVWWVSHCNAEEKLIAEFIEVSYCPQILQSVQEDVDGGLERLHALLEQNRLRKEDDHVG